MNKKELLGLNYRIDSLRGSLASLRKGMGLNSVADSYENRLDELESFKAWCLKNKPKKTNLKKLRKKLIGKRFRTRPIY